MFYVPLAQTVDYKMDLMRRIEVQSHYIGGMMLVTNLTPGALEPVLRRALAEVDPNLTLTTVRTMREQVARSFDQERAVASLAGLFGVVALVLAAVGLYGVTAYTVAQRTGEIGIRMALGAQAGDVVNLVVGQAFRLTLIGTGIGFAAAYGLTRVIASQLFGVSALDPPTWIGVVLILALSSVLAAWVPAQRAAHVDPMRALRCD
jgi:ABC-type antimicrobial peptide transport system permease subunit